MKWITGCVAIVGLAAALIAQPAKLLYENNFEKAELDKARKSGGPVPVPPSLPQWLVDETGGRYAAVYEGLTGKKL